MEQREWKKCDLQTFWRNIARKDHLVQLYESEKVFMETLEGYAGCGLLSGESVIIIATQNHLDELQARLSNQHFDLAFLTSINQYIAVEANEALAKFMRDGLPDAQLFAGYLKELLSLASSNGRHVRAFGEMVAELWQKGLYDATSTLEAIWANLHAQENFSLFCAYPKKCFVNVEKEKMKNIFKLPTMVIDGKPKPSTEIYYSSLN